MLSIFSIYLYTDLIYIALLGLALYHSAGCKRTTHMVLKSKNNSHMVAVILPPVGSEQRDPFLK